MRSFIFVSFMVLFLIFPAVSFADFSVEKDIIAAALGIASVQDGLRYLRYEAKSEKVDFVNSETHTQILTEYSDKGPVFILRYDDVALKNPSLLIKDLAFLVTISGLTGENASPKKNVFRLSGLGMDSKYSSPESRLPYFVAELITNANNGSPTAQAELAFIQERFLRTVRLDEDVAKNQELPAISSIR